LEWCRIARGSGQPGDFDVPVIIVFAASDRAAWRRSIGIGIGAIVVYGSAPTAHSITAHCPPAHDEDSDITAHCPPAYDEDSDALAGAALGSPSVMSKSAICSRRPSENTKTTHKCFSSSVSQPPHLAAHRPEQWGDHTALRDAASSIGFQHDFQQVHHVVIVNSFRHLGQQPVVPDVEQFA
jgi:hypothetical protein